jgi:FKBP-type peptidyl-prolyl cis-trans isomerase 2
MAGKTLTFDLHLLQVIKPQPAARPPETAQPVAPSPTVTQPNAPTETAATPQGPPAQAGDTVRAEYTGKLDDGTVFDSSEKRGPIQFTIGAHQVIPGFEQAVTGMKAGESKTVRIPPDQAYGPHRDELVRVVNRKDLPSGETLQVGKQTPWPGPNGRAETATVTALSKSTVTLDTNHPLAGKTLTFHLHLLQIIKPPAPPM